MIADSGRQVNRVAPGGSLVRKARSRIRSRSRIEVLRLLTETHCREALDPTTRGIACGASAELCFGYQFTDRQTDFSSGLDTMRFFITATEPTPKDVIDTSSMLRHRIASLDYMQDLINSEVAAYSFRDSTLRSSFSLLRSDSLEALDEIIKADPSWVFVDTEVTPVTTTAGLVREMQKALDQDKLAVLSADGVDFKFNDKEIKSFDKDGEEIDDSGAYTLAAKRLASVGPAVSEDAQTEIWYKTLASQRMHLNDDIEFSDHNPVGQPAGLLIGKGSVSDVEAHVAAAPIYPHTSVTYTELRTLRQAYTETLSALDDLRSPRPSTKNFEER